MKNITQWLDKNGLKYKINEYSFDDGIRAGIMVDTNYYGEQPPPETMKLQSMIANKIHRCKSWTCESRGHYTGMLIWKQ